MQASTACTRAAAYARCHSGAARSQVVATNSRKLLTITLSFIFFPKPLSWSFVFSGLAVVGGIMVKTYGRPPKTDKQRAE